MANYDTTNITVTIGGSDVTAYIQLSTLRIVSAITNAVDTAKFTISSEANISNWEEIIITDGATKIFAGYVLILSGEQLGVHGNKKIHYDVSCTDYSALLDKRLVREEYENKTDAYIINDLFTKYLPEITDPSTYVTTIRTLEQVRFNRVTLRKALDSIAKYSGADWYIDYDKALHFFVAEENMASFSLSDTPDFSASFGYQNFKDTRDATGVVNRVEVVGGTYLSEDETFYLEGTGQDVNILIPQKLSAPTGETSIQVYRNDGNSKLTTNEIVNPRFEVNITDGWNQYQAGSGGTFSRSTTRAYTGSASCKITAGTQVVVLQGANISLDPGEILTAQCRCWAEALNQWLYIYDVTNAERRAETGNRKTGEWERMTCGWQNDTGATVNVRVELLNIADDSTSATWFDAVQAEISVWEEGTWPTGYIDGSLGAGYAWTGTADNSTSTRAASVGDIWTQMTVKILNIDESTGLDDVLYSYQEQLLKWEVFWPNLNNAVRVTGRYEVPLFTRVRDTYSKDTYKLWLDGSIKDSNINTKQLAKLEGKNLLAKNSLEKTVFTLDCWEPGLRAGESITLVNTLFGINAKYLIQKVTTTITDKGSAVSNVEMGVYNPDLVGILIQLSKQSQEDLPWRDDETLDEVLEETEEVAVSESISEIPAATNVYTWGTDANQGYWNFSRWEFAYLTTNAGTGYILNNDGGKIKINGK